MDYIKQCKIKTFVSYIENKKHLARKHHWCFLRSSFPCFSLILVTSTPPLLTLSLSLVWAACRDFGPTENSAYYVLLPPEVLGRGFSASPNSLSYILFIFAISTCPAKCRCHMSSILPQRPIRRFWQSLWAPWSRSPMKARALTCLFNLPKWGGPSSGQMQSLCMSPASSLSWALAICACLSLYYYYGMTYCSFQSCCKYLNSSQPQGLQRKQENFSKTTLCRSPEVEIVHEMFFCIFKK